MDCRRVEELLPLYAGGDAGEALARRLSSHLRSCAGCRLLAEEHRRSRELLRSYDAPEFGDEFFEGIRSAVLRELAVGAARPTLLQRFVARLGGCRAGSLHFFPRGLALAALSAAALAFALFFTLRPARQPAESAKTDSSKVGVALSAQAPEAGRADGAAAGVVAVPPPSEVRRAEAVKVAAARRGRAGLARTAATLSPGGAKAERRTRSSAGKHLSEEESYLDAISALDAVISKHRGAMSPTLRVEYERSLSDVDRAIARTRAAALRHKDNPDMKDFVFAAYRGKVALLSEVAKQAQFPPEGL